MRELRRSVLKLTLISHANPANLDPSHGTTTESKGGKRPPGGIDRFGDYQLSYRQKSADHFVHQLRYVRTVEDLEQLAQDAHDAVDAWKRTLIPEGQPPEYGTPQWKRWVAHSPLGTGELARRFSVSRQYILRIKRDYGA